MPSKLTLIEDEDKEEKPWFQEGLRFKCTGCGQCCTGAPGYVWIDENEIHAIAEFLSLSREDFIQKYTRRVHGRLSLKENAKTYDCVFLKDKKCQIYPVRPTQCQTFPWWLENLESKEAWEEAALHCEGINHPDAPLIECEKILEHLD